MKRSPSTRNGVASASCHCPATATQNEREQGSGIGYGCIHEASIPPAIRVLAAAIEAEG